MSYHRVIGIDLGTTYSVVAAYNHDKHDVKVIPNKQNEPTTPSVVHIAKSGHIAIGRPAKQKLARDPDGVIFEVKRIMGEAARTGKKAMVEAHGKTYDPEFISACILKELKGYAERVIDGPVHDAVITVPAYFTEAQKNATREAAKIARLNPRLIINEPTAAAVAYGLDKGEAQTFIVYDFGGGTFDVSIVRVEDETSVEVLGTGGDAHLGGGDIDAKIIEWILGKMKAEHGRDFSGDKKCVAKLRTVVEDVKILLSNESAPQEIFVESPTDDVDSITYTITPQILEDIVRPLLARTVEQVDVALKSAADRHGLTLDDVEAFILVGGSSKLPMVPKLLKETYRKPVKNDLNPDEIVAMGAARMALNYDPSLAAEVSDDKPLQIDKSAPAAEGITSTHIKDVVSHTLGVGLMDDVYDPLIPKDHVIPHRISRGGYTTARDNQTSIFVPVYQGDNPKASQNTMLGQVVIDGLAPEPKGHHKFEITFALNADGIFQGEIHQVQTGVRKEIKLDRGDIGLTAKKRLALAEMLDSGALPTGKPMGSAPSLGGGGGASDATESLLSQAREVMGTLPADRQREIAQAIDAVESARREGDADGTAKAVAALTLLVMRIHH